MKITPTKENISGSWGERYRPRKLAHYIGNEDTIEAIKAFIKKDEIPQSILLSGPTGVGKTTLARIIAKEINQVDSFKKSLAQEENCAANTGVEFIRGLIDSTKFMPRLNYNVVILDEVHMLSTNATSALLKHLEDPSKTIWILCTNLPGNLLSTVQGRIMKLALDYPDMKSGLRILARVCKKEKVFLPVMKHKTMLKNIYTAAASDPRTMLNGLQNIALRFSKTKPPTPDDVMRIVQGVMPSDKSVDAVFEHILLGKPGALASMVNGYYFKMDMRFASELLKRAIFAQQTHARGWIVKTPSGIKVTTVDYVALSKITKLLGEAAKTSAMTPSIVSSPLVYAAALDAATFVKDNARD